ncbi:MAG: hypothetical protein HY926_07740 [Elusimicrobia bacterium]|nr:hypothetical protein [Elusimicrobiota bacterium]
MRLLGSLLLAGFPLGAWAGPAVRLSTPRLGPVPQILAGPACGLSKASLLSAGLPAHVPLSAPLPLAAAPPLLPAAPEPGVLVSVDRGVEAFTAARSDADQNQALADLFEGIASRDGAPVFPQVATPETMSHDRETAAAKDELARAAAKALPDLERSVWHGGWRGPRTTLHDSCCGDAAPKLGLLLRQMGHAVDAVEAEFHYYLILRLPFGEIVVDPTIRQFFGGARAPPSIPKVFVGTMADLHFLFARHAAAKTTSYDVARIYFRDARVRNSKIEEVRRLVQQRPESPEHQPLANRTASRPPPGHPSQGASLLGIR